MAKILIVDDEPDVLRLTSETARALGHDIVQATSGAEALSLLHADPAIRAVLLDLVMPELDGMAVLEAIGQKTDTVPVIVQTARPERETILSVLRLGATDFITKPATPERLEACLRNALELGNLRALVRSSQRPLAIPMDANEQLADSAALSRTLQLAQKAAGDSLPVLLEGEKGTGKRALAQAIHEAGERAGKPFITCDCAALIPDEGNAALFGPGGKIRQAQGGTIVLENIGALAQEAQAGLLDVISAGELRIKADRQPVRVNVRVIATTTQRLLNLAKSGHLREDLYYRLTVMPVFLPPLRDRPQDIASLAQRAITRFSAETGRPVTGLAPQALALLERYDWPGNIAQLDNLVYRAVLMAESGHLQPGDFPQVTAALAGRDAVRTQARSLTPPPPPVPIDHAVPQPAPRPVATPERTDRFLDANGEVLPLAAVERNLILHAIVHHKGHMSQVARTLGIGRSTLYRKLKHYNIETDTDTAAA